MRQAHAAISFNETPEKFRQALRRIEFINVLIRKKATML